jgi:hypothetical protein
MTGYGLYGQGLNVSKGNDSLVIKFQYPVFKM